MNCPHCESVRLVMSERQGIEIDYCPQCRGVWLDRGELDKIIERAGAGTQAGAPPPRVEDDERRGYPDRGEHQHGRHDPHRGGYYKKKKREGFLSDLFDFD
ncbi:MAG TPA: zf-TFIIB domain-containing protein [Pyrinomonadaceae bacterium]